MEESQSCLRVVVKVGTSTLTHDTGKLNLKKSLPSYCLNSMSSTK